MDTDVVQITTTVQLLCATTLADGDRADSRSLFGVCTAYDVPEIVVTPVIDGNADYLAWVAGEVR